VPLECVEMMDYPDCLDYPEIQHLSLWWTLGEIQVPKVCLVYPVCLDHLELMV